MSNNSHSPADDLVYDLVAIQYHALKAAQTYGKYEQDAQGHDDVQAFLRQCAEQDAERGRRCHELLGTITSGGSLDAG